MEIARRLRTKVKGVLYNDSLVILSQMCQCKVVEIKLCESKWKINSKLHSSRVLSSRLSSERPSDRPAKCEDSRYNSQSKSTTRS